jgi:hypothetical protein
MNKKTLAGMIFCVSASSVASASNDVSIRALELLNENRISYDEFVKLASPVHPMVGTWSNASVTDGTWSNLSISNSTWSNVGVTGGSWSNLSLTDSTWSNMTITGDASNPVNDQGNVPQPIISKGIDQ